MRMWLAQNGRFATFLVLALAITLYTFFFALGQVNNANILALSALNEEEFQQAVPAACIVDDGKLLATLLKRMAKHAGSSLVSKDDGTYLGVKFADAEDEDQKTVVDCGCVALHAPP